MKSIINYILSIILALSIIVFYFINLASSTILSEQYILSKLDEHDYYNKIHEQIKSNFENYIHQSGLEEDVLDNIITKEKVKKDTHIILGSIYDGLNQEVDTSEIKENLNKNIEKYIQNVGITNEQKNSIDTFVNHICNEYKSTISHFTFENQINQYYSQMVKIINMSKKVLLITIGIDFLLLIVLNLKKIYKCFTSVGVSFTIIGLIMLVSNIFINIKIKVQTILILNDAISEVLRNILIEILNSSLTIGLLALIFGIIMIIIPNLIHNYKKYSKLKSNDDETYEEKIKGE